jgi:hypothetical protein
MIHPPLKDTAIEILVSPMHFHRDKVQLALRAVPSINVDANATCKNQLHHLQCKILGNNLAEQLNFELAAKDSLMSQIAADFHLLLAKRPSLHQDVCLHALL